MGYCSQFELKVCDPTTQKPIPLSVAKPVIADFRATYEGAEYCLQDDGGSCEHGKWYQADDELKEFSKRQPLFLFIMDRSGEESGDIERYFALGGKMQKTKATLQFDAYNPKSLG